MTQFSKTLTIVGDMKKYFHFISVLVLLFITLFLISSTSLKKTACNRIIWLAKSGGSGRYGLGFAKSHQAG